MLGERVVDLAERGVRAPVTARRGMRRPDHRVTGHDRGELLLAPALGSRRAHREHEVADLGARVPHAHLDVVGQIDAELGAARRAARRRPGAVRRRSCTRSAAARAPATDSRSRACRRPRCGRSACSRRRPSCSPSVPPKPSSAIASRAVREQALPVRRVDPGARDDLRPVLRADVVLVELDDGVDRVGRDEALLDEQRLERAARAARPPTPVGDDGGRRGRARARASSVAHAASR